MAHNLVIVESPAKAKTISKFLGSDYIVEASMGHVRDLPKSKIGIDTEHNFEPTYAIPLDKKKVIKELKSKMKKGMMLWLATDEDREGEAIGWHILEALKIPESENVKRIVFHEITKGAILEALEHPRALDHDLINAQQARRVLDRLVGYELSPLLWKKIRYGLSAGRVQSVAVRLIVEREREIKAFQADEYWNITAEFNEKGKSFAAALNKIDGKKAEIKNEASAKEVVTALDGAAYRVAAVDEKQVKRTPAPPFITSTLQQEAARKLNFSVKKTMMLAQQMYEGVEIYGEHVGVITYMRTDSVNLSKLATAQAKEVIANSFGPEYSLPSPRLYKSKKGAQEAHEAIRPTDLSRDPGEIKQFLTRDQHRLYELIWKRTLACQMQEAILNQLGIDIEAEKSAVRLPYVFRATGQTIAFAGFLKVYSEGHDDDDEAEDEGESMLPKVAQGDSLKLEKLESTQHFTKPPPRYTEASLVKKLESEGIGRPSTYAPTISTVLARGYVEKEDRALKPTDTGEVVNDLLVEHFPNIVDLQFTAKMEEKLDDVADGKCEWVPLMRDFYVPFHAVVEEKNKTLKKEDIVNEETSEICEKCGKPMVIKLGRFGKFLSCSNYPECKNARPLDEQKSEALAELQKKFADKKCDKCGEPMEVKSGRFGNFLGCSKYPECKNIEAIVTYSGVKCPSCEEGQLIERRTRKGGRIFWGCNKFPKCKTATWDKPVKICEKCQGMVVHRDEKDLCKNCDADQFPKKRVGKKKKSED
ncbi:MAG: type I DNA topoisomerase [Patescibacteria group bacterium]